MDGNPKTFCRYTATIRFTSGEVRTVTEEPVRFSNVFEIAAEAVDQECFKQALATTGDDWPEEITLRVHSFETECTE